MLCGVNAKASMSLAWHVMALKSISIIAKGKAIKNLPTRA